MVIVVIGGSGSGKSEYAENLSVKLNQEHLVYIATMQAFDEESRTRIKKHRQMRVNKNFQTIECYTNLKQEVLQKNTTVLLECMSNLVANELYSEYGAKEHTFDEIKQGVNSLINQTNNLIIVTNNVFEDGITYNDETMNYLKILARVNNWLSSIADQVIEVIHGIPVNMCINTQFINKQFINKQCINK